MHKTTAIFLVFLYLVAMLRPIQPCLEYVLNQDYIAEFLCINKDKPELQCNGKCHLVKEIEKQQQQEPLSALSISMENYPIGFVSIYKLKSLLIFYKNNKTHYSYNQLYHFDYLEACFQPPDVV
ncbi:hypothetical protein N1F78_08000 [Seonamhaeicola sp. MEBiC1930]|uniref:hypothetical protein n=1 Tax=Seonamhaeicola sp. MEBiC01930 TaxID=2976768 RepID=UPI00324BB8DA